MSISKEPTRRQLTFIRDSRTELACQELQREAIHAFAALNGWDWSAEAFSFDQLMRRSTHGIACPCISTGPLDHPLWFVESYLYPAAIVGQPYDYNGLDADLARIARRASVHIPPAPYASIHYPGACRFIVFTRPGMTVQWLPEQAEEFSRFALHDSEWEDDHE